MKKLFFSAVALVAFSSVSKANTAVFNENVVIENLDPLHQILCLQDAIDVYNYIIDTHDNGVDDIPFLNELIGFCYPENC